jgi:polyisoprenoid-binding protein YceI
VASVSYVLAVKSSQLTVQAFAEGLAGVADHRPRFSFRDFSGDIEFDQDKLSGGSLHLAAKTRSLDIMDEVTQRDRRAIERVMFDEVLHPEIFPEVVFRSSHVVCRLLGESRYCADITGTVSLHGTTHPHSMQAQLVLSSGSLRAYGEFRLRQTDYGLTIASVAGGILRIKDELKFGFFIVARARDHEEPGSRVSYTTSVPQS